jgi:hypothetical protein
VGTGSGGGEQVARGVVLHVWHPTVPKSQPRVGQYYIVRTWRQAGRKLASLAVCTELLRQEGATTNEEGGAQGAGTEARRCLRWGCEAPGPPRKVWSHKAWGTGRVEDRARNGMGT